MNPGWTGDDFNGDGVVNELDYALINANLATPTTFVTGYSITDAGGTKWYTGITHVDVVTIGGRTDVVTGNSHEHRLLGG